MIYLTNSFSLQMAEPPFTLKVGETGLSQIISNFIDYWPGSKIISVIGHLDIARIVAAGINQGVNTEVYSWWKPVTAEQLFQRRNIRLELGDILYVIQVTGGRLPEGAITLPEGVSLQWLKAQLI